VCSKKVKEIKLVSEENHRECVKVFSQKKTVETSIQTEPLKMCIVILDLQFNCVLPIRGKLVLQWYTVAFKFILVG